jgi:hypothetical protein
MARKTTKAIREKVVNGLKSKRTVKKPGSSK